MKRMLTLTLLLFTMFNQAQTQTFAQQRVSPIQQMLNLERSAPATRAPVEPNQGFAGFVSEVPPPANMQPGQTAQVSVTFKNNTAQTWVAAPTLGSPTGHKLGSQSPQDNTTWGTNRFLLPGNVAPGAQVTVRFTIRAPQTPGKYQYSWAILNEGVVWLIPETSPQREITVGAPGLATICPGVTADITGISPAANAINQCIQQSAGLLELPAGIYLIDKQIRITKPFTLRSKGSAGQVWNCLTYPARCATLRVSPSFDSLGIDNGFLRVVNTRDVAVDHLILDGNRRQRLGTANPAWNKCKQTGTVEASNRFGFNASFDCINCSFTRSASINTLCGTALEWNGPGGVITDNVFRDNGDFFDKYLWADGLTVIVSDGVRVLNNQFVDNTDVNLIVGGSNGGMIQNNTIVMQRQITFAAMMLHKFKADIGGNFLNSVFSGNIINCGPLLCHFGIQIGPHPFSSALPPISGGTVTGNQVYGARLHINAEGATNVKVYGNMTTGTPDWTTCGQVPSYFNISPDSQVNRNGETFQVTNYTIHNCP